MPRAGMVMRGSGTKSKVRARGSLDTTGLPDPDLIDYLPIQEIWHQSPSATRACRPLPIISLSMALSSAREIRLRQHDLAALEAYLDARGRVHIAEHRLVAAISALIVEYEHSVYIVFEEYNETLFFKARRRQ